jgi:hypothetical protein
VSIAIDLYRAAFTVSIGDRGVRDAAARALDRLAP